MRFCSLVFVVCLLVSTPALAIEILSFKSAGSGAGEKITIRFSQAVDPKVFLAEHAPPRVVIDLPLTQWKKKKDYSSELIKAVRLGGHDATTSRLVIDLTQEVKLKAAKMTSSKKQGHRLVFEIIPDPNAGKEPALGQFRPITKPVVVIDPGHGGQDPGASGARGMKEKHITLAFAKALQQLLNKGGKYKVLLTRSDDRYLFLRDRFKVARKEGAELFISLHADSAPGSEARGLSVYTISEKASDKEAEALAANENKADIIGGIDLSGTSEDVTDILIDLAERETRGNSTRFAKLLIRNLARDVELLNNPHRFAGFAVLKAPDVPSVLVELGFLSSTHEERLLESDAYRRKVVGGIARAIDDFFEDKKKTRRGS